jgi:uridine kinase/ribulose-5-phosphate 4-epimerase/fuculose-1-phosphate aldolase
VGDYSLNELITISGSSGVGKTTLSELIRFVLKDKNVTVVNGDDSHKWERQDPNWNVYTHLNPKANNLTDEVKSISTLIQNKSIQRKKYNHDTGKFDEPVEILPSKYIVYEGLHSLHGEMSEISDLRIFVETENNLKKQWKLNRDTQKRGYTKKQVENILQRREKDEKLYIAPQKENADVIVRFEEKRDKTVHLEYECRNDVGKDIFEKVKDFYDLHRNFLLLCKKTSFEYDLVQHGGGNISYKFDNSIVITSSGKEMGDVSMLSGFTCCDHKGKKIKETKDRPSMELGLHLKIDQPVVFHTHPIYLNTILCSEESKDILSDVLIDYDYEYIPYITPGKDLKDFFNPEKESKIFLLENHGLICSGNSFVEVFNISLHINQLCKEWLIKNSKAFKTFANLKMDENKFLFPDAVVLPEKMKPINDYMIYIQRDIGLTPRFLTESEINKLSSMKEEKYRRSLL